MAPQTTETLQLLGALLPVTAFLGLLIYIRCRSADCPARVTAVTIATVCGAVLVSAGTLLLARAALGGGLFDLGVHPGKDGTPGLRATDLRTHEWSAPHFMILGAAVAVTVALWVLAMRRVWTIPPPVSACETAPAEQEGAGERLEARSDDDETGDSSEAP